MSNKPSFPRKLRMWKPVKKGKMFHIINRKKLHWEKYEGNFTLESIRKYAQMMSKLLKEDESAKQIQVAPIYENLGIRASKMTDVGEDIAVDDLSNSYKDRGEIKGFFIYYSK